MKVFVDTNIWLYLVDRADLTKSEAAGRCLTSNHELVISPQVGAEFLSVCSTKLGMGLGDTVLASEILDMAEMVPLARDDYELAVELHASHKLSIFDAMICSVAVTSGCEQLWTEDARLLGADIELEVVNPLSTF